jgi:hypothetical protein
MTFKKNQVKVKNCQKNKVPGMVGHYIIIKVEKYVKK